MSNLFVTPTVSPQLSLLRPFLTCYVEKAQHLMVWRDVEILSRGDTAGGKQVQDDELEFRMTGWWENLWNATLLPER